MPLRDAKGIPLQPLLPRAATLVAWALDHQQELEAHPKLLIELSFAHGFSMKWSIKVMGEQKLEEVTPH